MTSDIHSIDVLALATPPNGVAPTAASLDEFYAVLSDGHRRRLLDHLASVGTTTFEELVDAFAGETQGRESVETVLYHVHLPVLVDAGVIDSRTGVLWYDPPPAFDRLHDHVAEYSRVDDGGTLPADEGFALLASARRRHTLALLSAHYEISLPDVADEIATDEAGTSIVDLDPDVVLDVYLSLYHDHVPQLVDAELVDYDQERDLVTLRTDTAPHAASRADD